ncbi:uncharacterized protein BP5553_03235 [Venustampulla echinocandica]|uniref:DUF6594 domain-containing protein n=1 Tax=Venustampulla echinocandica TaxID=2656787 RepID=A0A370TTQ1_9HELO|nr:uncharacterized protein BP5553_03235 [Venustampulla echinocandica]RDL38895.1 hypothetical protein BP5553_03235 [Venustampulla echinocandica]
MNIPGPKSNGYEKLARLMSKHGEVAAFQRFDYLNNLNILYLQAELVHLEEELQESMKADLKAPGSGYGDGGDDDSSTTKWSVNYTGSLDEGMGVARERKIDDCEAGSLSEKNLEVQVEVRSIRSSVSRAGSESPINERLESTRDWWYLSTMESSPTWEIMLRTREKLKEYNEAVHRYSTLKAQQSPNPTSLSFLRRWFKHPLMGNFPLIGLDRNLWESSPTSSLVAIEPRKGPDPLSSLFLTKFFLWWHQLVGHLFKRPKSQNPDEEAAEYFEYTDRKVLKVANVVGTVISSSLLVGSTVVLYFVDNMLARLGIIAALTQVFGLVLVLVTNASKAEVFAATAA